MDKFVLGEIIVGLVHGIAELAYVSNIPQEQVKAEFDRSFDELVQKDAQKLPDVPE
jgi:hypothetical protein